MKQTGTLGLELIKKFEGCKLKAYKCPAGVWTIGWGHTANVKEGMTITQKEADDYLKNDLKIFEKYVNDTGLNLNQNQFDALVSFCYNCGVGNLKNLIKNRNIEKIADALLLYNKSGGKTLSGLTKRRKEERELFLKPIEYKVRTVCNLNIRKSAGTKFEIIRTAKKGEILDVIETVSNGNSKWAKNKEGFFSLKYCKTLEK